MRTIEVTLYQFDELSDKAKDNAINNCRYFNVDHDWWEFTYDDANQVGLKLEYFGLDRDLHATGKFSASAEETAHLIEKNHGIACETYKTAITYLRERDELIDCAERDEHGDFLDEYELDEKLDELDSEFLKSLLSDYASLLQREYEYLTSEEAIIETIRCNEYEFEEDGEMA